MNRTIRELLPHIYFMFAFLMSFLAVEQAVPFADQYFTYSALVEWLFVFGFILLINQHKIPFIRRFQSQHPYDEE